LIIIKKFGIKKLIHKKLIKKNKREFLGRFKVTQVSNNLIESLNNFYLANAKIKYKFKLKFERD
jgi:hypothetical protein